MASPPSEHQDGIGPISVVHSRRATRLRITVKPSGVRVSVPRGLTLAQGRDFARTHREWIGRHVLRMRQRERAQTDAVRNLPAISDADAHAKILLRLSELAHQHGLSFSRLTIRHQKTRWGSCTQSGAISLNRALARLPQRLMDYVILHELLHTRIRGHGRQFWEELEKLHPQARDHHRQLHRYSPAMMEAGLKVQDGRR
ncbi:MAG: YgjP-like metallopeptidase domain-containing protein [Syntrophaceae bacterium]